MNQKELFYMMKEKNDNLGLHPWTFTLDIFLSWLPCGHPSLQTRRLLALSLLGSR